MAKSPAHTLGERIGHVFEHAVGVLLQEFADDHELYLDHAGDRPARGSKTVKWQDMYGNQHDLDFVLEDGGTNESIGEPIAFVESAWRRLTKHSRNKAQEIQGALSPIGDTYRDKCEFLGAFLAGDFTDEAIAQLRSHGFQIAHFPYATVVEAFARQDLDISYEENTPTRELQAKVRAWTGLSERRTNEVRDLVARDLVSMNQNETDAFLASLTEAATREVALVRILPLHGSPVQLDSLRDAIAYVNHHEQSALPDACFAKYEILIRFTNQDEIRGDFQDKARAIRFLESLLDPALSGGEW